ncbi:hypothetical protein BJ912DRAFT_935461 [Pholiota molesta]|nr:hypothetical protein BJ912DRAFT_935461 [Pholiota molesta]
MDNSLPGGAEISCCQSTLFLWKCSYTMLLKRPYMALAARRDFGNKGNYVFLQVHGRTHVIGMGKPVHETVSIITKIEERRGSLRGEGVMGIFKGMHVLMGGSTVVYMVKCIMKRPKRTVQVGLHLEPLLFYVRETILNKADHRQWIWQRDAVCGKATGTAPGWEPLVLVDTRVILIYLEHPDNSVFDFKLSSEVCFEIWT